MKKKYEIEFAKKQTINKVPVFSVKTVVVKPTGNNEGVSSEKKFR
ncbi:MAG: hypothetical protein RBS48_04955 [Ignavibacteriaceae bacterium]|jgi:hypothetical protein|nr:hypothetical protein [Ignavibacteriaceae bacterium]